jgi:hypothetical protein
MKNIYIYYVAIIMPIIVIIIGFELGYTYFSAVILILYSLPYRLITDGIRLESKGLISRNKMWKLLIPGFRIDYTKELYFKK